MTTGGRWLQRWIDCFDPEDSRMTHRLHMAQAIVIASIGAPTVEHSDHTYVEFGRPRHQCDYRCTATWPKWTTDEMFDQAFALADAVQTERGNFNRAAAAQIGA